MSVVSKSVPVLNSLLYIKDGESDDFPEIGGQGDMWLTSSCIAVGCLPDSDGDTTVTLGPIEDVRSDEMLAFDGLLETPSRVIAVETVLGERLVEMPVGGKKTRVQIWTNGLRDTDIVIVGFG